ncbi:MAG: hypothetical protein GOV15_03715 [Candidatus Diapherotrites archaeon]|nr:hypothetical protein [Candidatus Diapherotrites archaeon]
MALYDNQSGGAIPSKGGNPLGLLKIAAVIAVVLVILSVVAYTLSLTQSILEVKPVTIRFQKTEVFAGSTETDKAYTTILLVDIHNPSEFDLTNVSMEARAIDPTNLIINEPIEIIPVVGRGETRKLAVPVYVSGAALAGGYSVEVTVTSKQESFDSVRAVLEVRSDVT